MEKYVFQQTGFSKVTITTTGIGIGTETPTFPLHITTYVASTQTYKFLNYSGIGGPGSYTNNYSIYCSNGVCASEFNAISDAQIKTNIENLELGLDIILQLKPVSYNYKNINRMGNNSKIGLIAQDVEKIIPSIVYSSYGQIHNINIYGYIKKS